MNFSPTMGQMTEMFQLPKCLSEKKHANSTRVLIEAPKYAESLSEDPLHYCRQANDSQVPHSWISPERDAWPCHIVSCAVGMNTG